MPTRVRNKAITVYRDISECYDLFENSFRLALDLETSGLSPYRDSIAVVSIGDQKGNVLVQHVYSDGWPSALNRLLRKPEIEWITHNGFGFDWLFLRNNGFDFPEIHYDTLIAEQTLLYQDRHGVRKNLATTMKRRLGHSMKMEMDHSGWTNPRLTQEQVDYCSADVAYLIDVADVQIQVAESKRMMPALEFEQRVSIVTTHVMWNGLPIDYDVYMGRREELIEESKEATARVSHEFPGLNVNSPIQVKTRVNDLYKLELPDAKKETLMEYQEGFPVLGDILISKAALKRTGFYDENFYNNYVINGVLHSHLWPLGAGTTRYTSSDPNTQQFPRNMRGIIGNEPGKVVVSADYAQIEVRLMAYYARDRALIEACKGDIHSNMARVMFSVPADEPVPSELRSPYGKYGTFSWQFGGSYKAIIRSALKGGTRLDVKTAKKMIAELNKQFRATYATHQRARAIVKNGGLVVHLPHGHRRAFQPGDATHTKWLNTTVQGSAAIGFKEALLEMDKRGLIYHIGGLVHDEFVATGVPEEHGEEFAMEMDECMVVGMERLMEDIANRNSKTTFIPVPIEIEHKIGEAWK